MDIYFPPKGMKIKVIFIKMNFVEGRIRKEKLLFHRRADGNRYFHPRDTIFSNQDIFSHEGDSPREKMNQG